MKCFVFIDPVPVRLRVHYRELASLMARLKYVVAKISVQVKSKNICRETSQTVRNSQMNWLSARTRQLSPKIFSFS